MREIKFRGKDIKTGEWVFGYLRRECSGMICDPFAETLSFIIYHGNINVKSDEVEVDTKTVGQYAGITDKNGMSKLYEGDIVKGTCSKIKSRCCKGIIQAGLVGKDVKGVIEYSEFYCQFYFTTDDITYLDLAFGLENIVKIGNIHENLELLKANDL